MRTAPYRHCCCSRAKLKNGIRLSLRFRRRQIVHVRMEEFVVQGLQFCMRQPSQWTQRSPRHVEREGSIQHHAMLGRMILGRKGLQIVKLKADKLGRDRSQKLGGQPQTLGFSRDLFPDMPRRTPRLSRSRGLEASTGKREALQGNPRSRLHRDLNNRCLDSGPSRPDHLLRPRPAAQTSPERYDRGIE